MAIPVLAWPEVAGAVARRTGVAENGHNAVNAIRALRWIESVSIDPLLAETATKIAGNLKLRGADAVYVALAVARKEPLITLDTEMLERAREVAEVLTPEQWLQNS
ncbi:MAG: PIN domain-containing protein [Rhodocyclaceae bacterium]|nr:MAG: PIN domain-containing protein [Rhodocyclaceae bacterium]